MNSHLQIHLLRAQPAIQIDDQLTDLPAPALKLLILLADKGDDAYLRDEFVRILFGNDTDARESFRKRALYPLRQRLKDDILQADRNDFIIIQREDIWVDSLIFSETANRLLNEDLVFGEAEQDEAEQILRLYQQPFLSDFLPEGENRYDDTRFQSWQRERRRELAVLHHQLLDRVTCYCLTQEALLQQAKRYAWQWYKSPNAGLKALQVLIGLAQLQQSVSLDEYVAELRRREEAGELPMGRSWKDWERSIRQGRVVPLDQLFGTRTSRSVKGSATTHEDTLERRAVVEELGRLFMGAREKTVFGLVGLPGSGKTELALRLQQVMQDHHPAYNVVYLELPLEMDLEVIANSLLIDLGRDDLLALDYGSKRQHLRQIVQMPDLLVIVDEGYSTHLANATVRATLLELLSGARVMLVAREVPGFDHYLVTLDGFKEAQTRKFLAAALGWQEDEHDEDVRVLAEQTRGLPLMLSIIASGLRSQRGRLSSLLERLRARQHDEHSNIFEQYDLVLEWLWQYLTTADKNLLFAISLFSPEGGVSPAALEGILGEILPQPMPRRLGTLTDLQLVRRVNGMNYSLHPIVREYVRKRSDCVSRHARRTRQAFVRQMLEYARDNAGDYAALDVQQGNILQMLEMILVSDEHTALKDGAVAVLHGLYPYLEQRGLYRKAEVLLQASDLPSLTPAARLQTFFYLGKLAKFQARYEDALRLFGDAMTLAEREQITERMGSLLFYMGEVNMFLARYDLARADFARAEPWAQMETKRPLLVAIWSNIGVCHYHEGYFEKASDIHKQVEMYLGESFDDLPSELKPASQFNQNSLGLTHLEMRSYDGAKAHFERALAYARSLESPELMSLSYVNLGVAQYFLKKFEESQNCFSQAKMLAERINNKWLLTEIERNEGSLLSARFQHHRAFMCFRSALISAQDNQLETLKSDLLIAIAKAYIRLEQTESAANAFCESLRQSSGSVRSAAQSLYGALLSRLMAAHLVGDNRVERAIGEIDRFMSGGSFSSVTLFSLPAPTILRYMRTAADTFQHELDHLPQLSRFRIVEAFEIWLARWEAGHRV